MQTRMKERVDTREDGMALIVAMIFIIVSVIVLTSLASRMINHTREINHFNDYMSCSHGAEYALAQSISRLEKNERGSISLEQWDRPSGVRIPLPVYGAPGVGPLTVPGMPKVEYFAMALDWARDGLDNNGDGIVDGPEEKDWCSVYASARCGQSVRYIEAVLRREGGAAQLTQVSWREVFP